MDRRGPQRIVRKQLRGDGDTEGLENPVAPQPDTVILQVPWAYFATQPRLHHFLLWFSQWPPGHGFSAILMGLPGNFLRSSFVSFCWFRAASLSTWEVTVGPYVV